MRAIIQLDWQPTTSAGLHHQKVEVYGPAGLEASADLNPTDVTFQFTGTENSYYNIYVYSLNSQNQGNSASVGIWVPSYTDPNPPPESVPDAPTGLMINIVGWTS